MNMLTSVNQSVKLWMLPLMEFLQSLDPYSAYMSPEVFNDMQQKQVVNLEDLELKLVWSMEL